MSQTSEDLSQGITITMHSDRPWLFKGDVPGPGRPKGSRNKQTTEQREFAQVVCYGPEGKGWEFMKDSTGNGKRDFQRLTAMRLYAGDLSPAVEQLIYFYLLGKPVERLEVREVPADFAELTIEQLRERAAQIAGGTIDMVHESDAQGPQPQPVESR